MERLFDSKPVDLVKTEGDRIQGASQVFMEPVLGSMRRASDNAE